MSKKDDAAIIVGESPWEDATRIGSGKVNIETPLSLRQELAIRFVEAYAKGGHAPPQGTTIRVAATNFAEYTLILADKILENENA